MAFTTEEKEDRNIQPTDLFSEYKTSSRNIKYGKCQPWCLKIESSGRILIVRYLKNVFKQKPVFLHQLSLSCPLSKAKQDKISNIQSFLSSFSLLKNKPKQQATPKICVQEMRPNNFLFVVCFLFRGPQAYFTWFPFQGRTQLSERQWDQSNRLILLGQTFIKCS